MNPGERESGNALDYERNIPVARRTGSLAGEVVTLALVFIVPVLFWAVVFVILKIAGV